MKTIVDQHQHKAVLEKWRGSPARIWIFDVSLTRLGIRLARTDEAEVLYIVGVSCERIVGPFSWLDAQISIVLQSETNESFDRVIDKKAGFELQCLGVVVLIGPATDFDKTFTNFLGDMPLAETPGSS